MNLLLDTHVWLWWLLDDPRLAKTARAAVLAPDNQVFVSSISLWEVQIKRQSGKLRLNDDLRQPSLDRGIEFISFTMDHANEVYSLPSHHNDPFDRALMAQARVDRLILLTADSRIALYADAVDLLMTP